MASVVDKFRHLHTTTVSEALAKDAQLRSIEKQVSLCREMQMLRRTRPTPGRQPPAPSLEAAEQALHIFDTLDADHLSATLVPERQQTSRLWREATVYILLLRYSVRRYMESAEGVYDDTEDVP